MDINPYQAPAAKVEDVAQGGNLAERGTRFAAAFIDGLILLALWMPVMFLTGYFRSAAAGTLGVASTIGYSLGAFVVFVLLQAYPLARGGQTWGKRILGIRIVTLGGDKPPLGALLLRRYLPPQLVGAIPVVGVLLTLANLLFIFRADRRCVHDLIAGTKVVEG